MTLSRRRFVKAGTAALAWAGLPLGRVGLFTAERAGAATSAPSAPSASSGDLFSSAANFTPYVHTLFRIQLPGSKTGGLELTQVDNLIASAAKAGGRAAPTAFSLLFDGSRSAAFTQGTYAVQHPSLGGFRLFLVRVGRTKQYYEANINRLAR